MPGVSQVLDSPWCRTPSRRPPPTKPGRPWFLPAGTDRRVLHQSFHPEKGMSLSRFPLLPPSLVSMSNTVGSEGGAPSRAHSHPETPCTVPRAPPSLLSHTSPRGKRRKKGRSRFRFEQGHNLDAVVRAEFGDQRAAPDPWSRATVRDWTVGTSRGAGRSGFYYCGT